MGNRNWGRWPEILDTGQTFPSFFTFLIIYTIKFKYPYLDLALAGHNMGSEISEREVLNSLSLSQLKKIAKAFDIDIKPKISEMPLIKIRGEKHFIVEKIWAVIGITIEDIDNILGTDFSKGGTGKTGRKDTQVTEKEDAKGDFKVVLLDRFVDEDNIEIILFDLNLSVSGNKDAQIERIIDSGQIEVPDIIKLLDKDVLIEVCNFLGLETTGTDKQLKNRILINQGFDVQTD